ncbi:MAG: hypothetical protein AAF495_08885 [Pseudomonadota bacterium]
MIQSLRPLALAVVLLWAAIPSVQAQDLIGERRPCEATVQKQLDAWNLTAEDISAIDYVKKWGMGGQSDILKGVNAWVGLRSCRGELVIDMRRDCSLMQAYATGDCGRAVK